jgi:protein-S-isoprenylcysteine O-methyltransferase Ste14
MLLAPSNAAVAVIAESACLVALSCIRLALQRQYPDVQFVRRRPATWRSREGVAFVLYVSAGVCIAYGTLAALLATGPQDDALGRAYVVAALTAACLGLGIVAWAQVAMGAAWRIGMDYSASTALVTTGPFRIVRNPIYVGLITIACSLTVLVADVGMLLGTASFIAWAEVQVRWIEEPFLAHRHDGQYGAWSGAVGRFLPYMGRLRGYDYQHSRTKR